MAVIPKYYKDSTKKKTITWSTYEYKCEKS